MIIKITGNEPEQNQQFDIMQCVSLLYLLTNSLKIMFFLWKIADKNLLNGRIMGLSSPVSHPDSSDRLRKSHITQ